jgi:hypothetical protein
MRAGMLAMRNPISGIQAPVVVMSSRARRSRTPMVARPMDDPIRRMGMTAPARG